MAIPFTLAHAVVIFTIAADIKSFQHHAKLVLPMVTSASLPENGFMPVPSIMAFFTGTGFECDEFFQSAGVWKNHLFPCKYTALTITVSPGSAFTKAMLMLRTGLLIVPAAE